ncbi:hypothetical protein OSB04_031043 [Centaurea solstitialis]|uniref:J domain-containing protein n=1 Tax=Centaurea solstitialis TaxID=347529 RepID=A0AA38W4D3_9ASTR|nr:hypothetical protein OSB04_031043 [Centaurea solstitialis]
MPMANISPCFGSNPCMVKPQIVACRSSSSAISQHDTAINFYELLSLSSNKAGSQEIKRAYRRLALRYHPDVYHDEDATKTFVSLQKAYKTLVDPKSREAYDSTLGYRESGRVFVGRKFTDDDVGEGRRWEGQIAELKKRSSNHKEGSWGSRFSSSYVYTVPERLWSKNIQKLEGDTLVYHCWKVTTASFGDTTTASSSEDTTASMCVNTEEQLTTASTRVTTANTSYHCWNRIATAVEDYY